MNILFISTWFPYPLDNGSRIRISHLLRALGKQHRVHLLAFLPPQAGTEFLQHAHDLCETVQVVERNPFWRDPRLGLRAHLSLTPRDVLRGYSLQMQQLAIQASKQQNFDVVIASTLEVAGYAVQIQNMPRILEEHNFTTRWMHERYQMQATLPRKAAGWVTYQKCLRYERRLYPYFSVVSMVSESDLQAVKQQQPAYSGRVAVIPNGVDLETHRPGLADPLSDTIVFNGSLTYAANLEAVRWFCTLVLPLIHVQRPGVRLRITGNTDGVDLAWLRQQPQVELTGYLEDVRPAVAGAWLAVAPLRSGGGTRLKILEAMALGAPVVATSKGAEGLDVTDGENILIADEPQVFAAHCLRLLESPELRSRLAVNARRLVEAHYGWQAIGTQFRELVEQTVERSGLSAELVQAS